MPNPCTGASRAFGYSSAGENKLIMEVVGEYCMVMMIRIVGVLYLYKIEKSIWAVVR